MTRFTKLLNQYTPPKGVVEDPNVLSNKSLQNSILQNEHAAELPGLLKNCSAAGKHMKALKAEKKDFFTKAMMSSFNASVAQITVTKKYLGTHFVMTETLDPKNQGLQGQALKDFVTFLTNKLTNKGVSAPDYIQQYLVNMAKAGEATVETASVFAPCPPPNPKQSEARGRGAGGGGLVSGGVGWGGVEWRGRGESGGGILLGRWFRSGRV